MVHSYGWYMRKYVANVKAAGATPIVFSLVPRNSWKDGKAVRSSGNNYGGWSQQISQATETTFVDHNEIIAEGLDALGPEKGALLFADGKLHTTAAGAVLNARFAVSGLKSLAGNPFEKYLSPAGREVAAFKPTATTSPTTHAALWPMRLVIIGDSTVCEFHCSSFDSSCIRCSIIWSNCAADCASACFVCGGSLGSWAAWAMPSRCCWNC